MSATTKITTAQFTAQRVQNMPSQIKERDSIPNIKLSRLKADCTSEDFYTRIESKGFVLRYFVPGAFTPKCDGEHLPSMKKTQAIYQKLGVSVHCVACNDRDVMAAWLKGTNIIADPDFDGNFTEACGLGMDKTEPRNLGFRAQRARMLSGNGEVLDMSVEPDSGQVTFRSNGEYLLEKERNGLTRIENIMARFKASQKPSEGDKKEHELIAGATKA
jgi:peroxiredoxin